MGNFHSTASEPQRKPLVWTCLNTLDHLDHRFKTFQTSRNLNFGDTELQFVAMSREDYRRWSDMIFNSNKVRFPGGLIPNAYPRRHVPHELDIDTLEPKRVDLDFFEDSNVLFETHPFAGHRSTDGGILHRKDLAFDTSTILVLIDQEELEAWSSTASVEQIDAIDIKWGFSKGAPERHWTRCC